MFGTMLLCAYRFRVVKSTLWLDPITLFTVMHTALETTFGYVSIGTPITSTVVWMEALLHKVTLIQ